ncbi:hypothetical protein FHR90_001164 [Endobacter medicaginis]|uniref:Uncharacterized protein n=2 Tax=Endobacter medicaginis TaxID=1181271 RepID=A0A839V1E7_9PROT|nr:hypothetical protein [Endobacter medicaginis]MBB3173341.1 hypothetical protein [Endobacter medicaginis]MCX5476842.1 hypothetical protein [Endobacter medicaginis]
MPKAIRLLAPLALTWLATPAPGADPAPPVLAPATIARFYEQAAAFAAQRSGIALDLPGRIPPPAPGQHLTAWADPALNRRRHAAISFDTTPDCHGAHYCSLGAVTVSPAAPQPMRDLHGMLITRRLPDGTLFTPEHAMADTFPAQLQWREGSLTYTVTWSGLPPQRAEAILAAVRRSAGALPG